MNSQQLNDAIALHIGRLMIENTVLKGQLEAAQTQVQTLSAQLEELKPPPTVPKIED